MLADVSLMEMRIYVFFGVSVYAMMVFFLVLSYLQTF
jgi:hypothetical protein